MLFLELKFLQYILGPIKLPELSRNGPQSDHSWIALCATLSSGVCCKMCLNHSNDSILPESIGRPVSRDVKR